MVFRVPGYYFSQPNYDMISGTSIGSINLLQNNNFWNSMANSVLYMTPNIDSVVGLQHPQFGIYGNYLLNPTLAIAQVMQQQQQGGGWGFNFNNLLQNMQNSWQPNITGGGSSSTLSDDDKMKLEKTKDEIKYLTVLLNEIQKVAENDISSTTKNKIKVALSKTSSAKTELARKEEILAALKDAYKAVDKKIVRKVMSTMPEVKDDLFDAGYNFSINSYGFKPTAEKSTASAQAIVNSIAPQIAGISDSNPTSAQSGAGGLTSANIVNVISLWNDSHHAGNDRSIIRAITQRMNEMKKADKQKDVMTSTIKPMSLALMGTADNLLQEHSNDFDDATKQHLTKLKDNLNTIVGQIISNGYGPETQKTLIRNFENLYLQIRKMSALSAQKKLEQKYKFIDNIQSGTSDDVFNSNLFQKATKEDLIKEGFTSAEADSSKITVVAPVENDDDIDVEGGGDDHEEEPSEITPQFLTTDARVEKQVVTVNGYNNTYYKYNNKFYRIKNDEVKEVGKPAGWKETSAPVADDNNGGTALPTKQELAAHGTKLTKIEVTLPNGNKKTIEGAKIDQFGEFYEYNGKIYQIKDDTVKERNDVKKA